MTTTPPTISQLLDFSSKVVLVTGASGNIGAGIARRFHDAGATVMLHSVNRREQAEQQALALGGRAAVAIGDVERDAESICAQTIERFGRIDVLVNNAGIQPVAPLLDLGPTDVAEMLRVNVGGVVGMTRQASIHMSTNDRAHGMRGAVVNIASIEGIQAAFMHSHYVASKGAVIMHTKAAASELGAVGIRVNSVSPGLIDVEGLDAGWPDGVARWKAAAPLIRLGEPSDVADAVLFLASVGARWITGANLVVDGGVLTHNTW
jgi:NAD(P)-dependent dehydrogenase (short-subunit alcohol dehydrogenase family)